MRSYLVLFAVLATICSLMLSSENGVEAENGPEATRAPGDQVYPAPNITLSFDEERFGIDPHPTTGGSFSITGDLTCDIPSSVPPTVICRVTMIPVSTILVTFEIDEYFFNGYNSKAKMDIRCEADPDLRGGDSFTVEISVHWVYDKTQQGSKEPEKFHTTVYVPPNGRMDLIAKHTGTIEMEVGEWDWFMVEVMNHANMAADFELKVIDLPENIVVEFEEGSFRLNSYQTKVVSVGIKQTSGKGRVQTFTIRAESDLPVEQRNKDLELEVRTSSKEEGIEMNAERLVAGAFFIGFLMLMATFFIILRSRTKRR